MALLWAAVVMSGQICLSDLPRSDCNTDNLSNCIPVTNVFIVDILRHHTGEWVAALQVLHEGLLKLLRVPFDDCMAYTAPLLI